MYEILYCTDHKVFFIEISVILKASHIKCLTGHRRGMTQRMRNWLEPFSNVHMQPEVQEKGPDTLPFQDCTQATGVPGWLSPQGWLHVTTHALLASET